MRISLALAVLVILLVSVCAELQRESGAQLLSQMALGLRAEADLYCFAHQGDGCWPQGDADEDDPRIAAREQHP